MQPDRQSNYWDKDTDEAGSDKITEMYEPEPMADESVGSTQPNPLQPVIDDAPVHWSANEYTNDDKNSLWFVIFAIVVLALIAVDFLLLKSYTFSVLVIVMAIAVIVFATRPPRQINYTLSGAQGLYIGEKLYHFSEFKSFGLIQDHNQHSIMLMPTKRFSLSVSVYFPEEAGERIIDILGARLPMENLKLDIIDIIVKKLRL